MRNFYPDDIHNFPEHWHDPWIDPRKRSTAPIYFVWGVAHVGDGDHGRSCAERAYEAPGIDRPTKPQMCRIWQGVRG